MKKISYLLIGIALTFGLLSCEDDWDKHYSQQQIQTGAGASVEVVNMSSTSYLEKQQEYQEVYQVFKENGLIDQLTERNQSYTLLVCENESFQNTEITDVNYFINSSVSDVSMSPTQMTDGATLKMWCGKYLKITTPQEEEVSKASESTINDIYISGVKVLKVIKTEDAYIYVMEKPVLAPKSLYEVFEDLDDTKYSMFKELVRSYEIREFDKANSAPNGVDATGNTTYDSVFVIKNTYLDRYKKSSTTLTWNMRSEAYTSTMFIPDNEVFSACIEEACRNVKQSLLRAPNAADTLKFKEWIARACFYSREVTPEDLQGEEDINSISGYQENSSYNVAASVWRPTVQKIDLNKPIFLSNGMAYYVTYMHIPNNIVIWRIKNRLYNTYDACSAEEKEKYFVFENVKNIGTREVNKGGVGGWGWDEEKQAYTWPKYLYTYVYGCPSGKAFDEKLPVSLEITGITLQEDGTVAEVMVPPGEYNLRMGWMSAKQKWSMDVYFNDSLVKTGIPVTACHYDRGGKAEYSEYYNPADWASAAGSLKNAQNYDKDGYQVGVVRITGTEHQKIRIKMVSKDMTEKYKAPGTTTDENGNKVSKDGTDSKGGCIMCYHWCLRPTSNNY